MQVIRTRSVGTIFTRMAIIAAVFFLGMFFAAVAFAETKPPDALFKHVTSKAELVHRGQCNVPQRKLRNVECLVFYDQKNDIIYLVLFAQKNSQPYVTNVIGVKHDRLTELWTHPQHGA